jgi:hypothetical protein
MKRILIAVAALSAFAAPAAMAQSHGDGNRGHGRGYSEQRYNGYGNDDRWRGGYRQAPRWNTPRGYGYDAGYGGYRGGDRHARRGHGRPMPRHRGW